MFTLENSVPLIRLGTNAEKSFIRIDVQFVTSEIRLPLSAWPFCSLFNLNENNLNVHHVISLLEEPGILGTNMCLLLIYHQTPRNKWPFLVIKYII